MMEEAIRRAGLLVPRLQETGRKLGEGSYGEVVEVRVEGKLYAGKRLHAFFYRRDVPPAEKDAISKRFEEECLRLPRLRHPNIMQVVGVHFHPSTRQPTLVMELLPTSLSEYLETHPATSPHVKHSILLDVARGLEYLHSLPPPLGPVVHRDLTANNVLLTPDTRAKIADLGQARIIDRNPAQLAQQRRWTTCPGNVAHMPPEALLNTPTYDAALDVFSFGVVMLHTLTQEWPEPSADRVPGPGGYRLVKEVKRRRRYLDKLDNPLLKPLVMQCLNDTAELRPSAGDLVGALDMLMRLEQTVQQKTQENQVLQQEFSQERNEKMHLQQQLKQMHQQYQQLSRELSQPRRPQDHPTQHTPQHVAYAGQPGAPPPAGLGVDSAVQLVQDSNRTGVIRWIGYFPGIQGLKAGVELVSDVCCVTCAGYTACMYTVQDEPMEGCGDGEWRGQRCFSCLPGRGFFCPAADLRADARVMSSYFRPQGSGHPSNRMSQYSAYGDFLCGVAVVVCSTALLQFPEWEEQDQNMADDQITKYLGEERGIQGHQNSCYLDATIFGLFALSDVFDSLFLESGLKSTPGQIQREISEMLWRGIVNPLRK